MMCTCGTLNRSKTYSIVSGLRLCVSVSPILLPQLAETNSFTCIQDPIQFAVFGISALEYIFLVVLANAFPNNWNFGSKGSLKA
jgi:hypothetical protein